jgi:hypothetical protein
VNPTGFKFAVSLQTLPLIYVLKNYSKRKENLENVKGERKEDFWMLETFLY